VVGTADLADGQRATVVLVGPRSAPKGAALLLRNKETDQVDTLALGDVLQRLMPGTVIDILAMQERLFGDAPLPVPPDIPDQA